MELQYRYPQARTTDYEVHLYNLGTNQKNNFDIAIDRLISMMLIQRLGNIAMRGKWQT